MTHNPQILPKAKRSTWNIPYLVCQRCGLIYLKNAVTAKAIKLPCKGLIDAS